jgi:thioredoxin reductase (NADPH)
VTWVVPLALGGFAILLMAVFTMVSARRRHRMMVSPAATQQAGPRILVHDINDDRCTGCDACVAVCPTNVLDLVANKSRVLRFQDCIQCEACMIACPTEALVMFPQGAIPPPLKVPEVDEMFQTVVPGQYLIGEVAGKPLVKNAANLGRAVVEHMLTTGLQPGALGQGDTVVDVAIVGSGPGGLSAALTCRQRGLSYVVLEKEQSIASTISRYPKGKLVMAEPYDTVNYSFLPIFDSAKEQLIPIWQELLDRVGIQVRRGESVETVKRGNDGVFEIRTTVGAYRAQRVVLSIGTRGKPRTLQVPGENLPKVVSLLEDPDEFRGRSVLVVGGGDSACEAALALSDAGAKVMISYRGKGFNRAAPRNKQAMEQYAAEGRIKVKLGSQVLGFEQDSVTLALGDGSQKRYPNDATFVLIGADPPIQWLEKVGVRFVERPHQYQMGKTDDIVRRFVARAIECPEDAARAAAQVLGGSVGVPVGQPMVAGPAAATIALSPGGGEPVTGPRKWLRSATSIFSNRTGTNPGIQAAPPKADAKVDAKAQKSGKKFDAPVPLSEFAKRGKTQGAAAVSATGQSSVVHHMHTGHGRRDQLSAGERTRILRMLRDEGGRLADEDSSVYIGAAPGDQYDKDFDDAPSPPPAPVMRPDVPAKPALVVGLEQAKLNKKPGGQPPAPRREPPPPMRPQMQPPMPMQPPMQMPPQMPMQMQAPMHLQQPPPPPRVAAAPAPAPSMSGRGQPARRPVPPPFSDEPTRQVDDELLTALRSQQQVRPSGPGMVPPQQPPAQRPSFHDEPTRMQAIDPRAYDETGPGPGPYGPPGGLGMRGGDRDTMPRDRFPANLPSTDPGGYGVDNNYDEATSIGNLDGMAAMERARHQGVGNDERTRAVNIHNDPSISDIDWDLD